jgi:hypothetical protein
MAGIVVRHLIEAVATLISAPIIVPVYLFNYLRIFNSDHSTCDLALLRGFLCDIVSSSSSSSSFYSIFCFHSTLAISLIHKSLKCSDFYEKLARFFIHFFSFLFDEGVRTILIASQV